MKVFNGGKLFFASEELPRRNARRKETVNVAEAGKSGLHHPNLFPSLSRMKTRNISKLVGVSLVIGLAAGTAHAQSEGTGVGVIVGEPTGISAKHWLDEDSAIDAALGWSFEGRTSFHVHADWLWHDFTLIPVEKGSLPIHYGIGARFKGKSGSQDRAGIRVPVGLGYHFDEIPLEVFAEVAPILDVTPSSEFNVNVALGARWYFR